MRIMSKIVMVVFFFIGAAKLHPDVPLSQGFDHRFRDIYLCHRPAKGTMRGNPTAALSPGRAFS
jgi:hypothetical protein